MSVSGATQAAPLDTSISLPRQKHHVRTAFVLHVIKLIRSNAERIRLNRSIKPHEKYIVVPLAKMVTPLLHQGVKRILRDRLPSDPITTTQALRIIIKLQGIGSWLARQNVLRVPGLNYLHKCFIVVGRYLFVVSRDAVNILKIPEITRQGVERICKIAKEELDAAAERYRNRILGMQPTASSSVSSRGKTTTASAALGGLLLASRTAVRRKTAEKRSQKTGAAAVQVPNQPSPKEKFLKSAASRGVQIGSTIGLEVFKQEAIRGISALETILRQKGVALAADRLTSFALYELTKLGLRITFIYGVSCAFQQIAPDILSQSLPFVTLSIYKIASLVLWAHFLLPTISDLHDEYDKECNLALPTGLPTRDQFDSLVREFIQKIISGAEGKTDLTNFKENFGARIKTA